MGGKTTIKNGRFYLFSVGMRKCYGRRGGF
jgi:hypothetical protein